MKRILIFVSMMLIPILVSAEVVLHRGTGGEPATLDPHQASGTWENAIVGDMFLGLVTEDDEANTIPGAATRWEIKDGVTYTFYLRKGALWSDGVPVTAEDFVFAFRRILGPKFPAKYANLLYPIKNAQEYKTDKVSAEELGVRAISKDVLEITLENPTPYFLAQLKHYTAFPIPKHAVEKHGDNWVKPGNMVNNGAYVLTDWIPNTYVTAVKNQKFYDAKNVKIDKVFYYPTEDESAALKRFRSGELHMSDGFPNEQIEWLRQNLPNETKVGPYLGIYYYTINHRKGKFQDKRVREALSTAIDREIITDKVLRAGNIPAYSFVPPISGYQVAQSPYATTSIAQRKARAKELMEAAGFSKNKPLEVQIRYNTDDNHKRVAIAVASMWKDIHVKTTLFNSDVAVHYEEMEQGNYEIGRAGWIADYPDAQNFLFLFQYPNALNYGAYSNSRLNQLMEQAGQTVDLKKRASIMQQAEQIALDDFATIPIYYYVYKQIVSQKLQGWKGNAENIHRSRFMNIVE